MPDTVHTVPPTGSAFTPCCNRTLFEVPPDDKVSLDPAEATCTGSEYVGRKRSNTILDKQIKSRMEPDG